ncbi:hypothetical protein [Streptomyces sp. XD-27]|uniref:hypothetical protein n=1 Tax=Streptomyces sp. XD-27 TaxID=3062779 RepID=UPI0026F43665|nr:hypothetical protein [Streptomyces sp. XD-27]WKX69979.1 hypothetical protein Q3Y56_08690 [Streptomyces sp. XD-27]
MSRRSALRFAVASVALAGAVLAPASAFAAETPGDKGGGGQGPVLPVGTCVVSKEVSVGAGTVAVLLNTNIGPYASFKDAGDGTQVTDWLDRKHPKLPESAGVRAEILDANSASPKLLTKFEGGDVKPLITAFPKAPTKSKCF